MKIKGRRMTGTAMTAAGIFLIVAAGLLFLHNTNESHNAEKEILNRLPAVRQIIETRKTKADTSGINFGGTDEEEYIGILEIPSAKLEMPVFSRCSEENLKLAPCCYHGSARKENLVIAGHNYSSGFGKLEDVSLGENVYFTDINGNIYSYTVSDIEVLEADDILPMINSRWALSLYTCTYSGKQRLTVRCQKTQA